MEESMNLVKNTKLFAALVSLLILSACSQGFKATGDEALDQESSGNSDTVTPTPSGPSEFDKLDLRGHVDGGMYDKALSFDLDKVNNALIINLPIPANPFIDLYLDIPELKGAKIKAYQDAQQNSFVAISIPLKYVVKGASFLPSNKLPNGQSLPRMPSGEAPSLAISLGNNQKVHLYIGVNAVGMYIESSYIPSNFGVTLPIKNQARTRILGYLTIVPKTTNFNGGVFVALPLPAQVAKIIDDHLAGIIQ